jgi:hypothetical protein
LGYKVLFLKQRGDTFSVVCRALDRGESGSGVVQESQKNSSPAIFKCETLLNGHLNSYLTLYFQEFHVAYVFIKMANSPRPGVWALERSTDYGLTWKPWQYFADTHSDCLTFFNTTLGEIETDDSVLCTTGFSKVVPLEGGEVRA